MRRVNDVGKIQRRQPNLVISMGCAGMIAWSSMAAPLESRAIYADMKRGGSHNVSGTL